MSMHFGQAHHDVGYNNAAVDLENQFILRLPPEPAQALREALRSGATNLHDRLALKLEPEKAQNNLGLRRGQLVFDGWTLAAKLMDLPTIIESQKTIDKKTFYKTADICQILICQEGEFDDEDEDPMLKKGKKDPNKVDKKYLFRHGVAPPLKNCRRRRFRKTLKKKFVEAAEIEKEVKGILRHDNEAVSVKWELTTEEDLNSTKQNEECAENEESSMNVVDERDLFGDLSDYDDDGGGNEGKNPDDLNEDAKKDGKKGKASKEPTEFSKEMFQSSSTSNNDQSEGQQ